MKTKTILLTGGLGFLGARFSKFFAEKKYQLIILDILPKIEAKKQITKIFNGAFPSNVKYFQVDITKKEELIILQNEFEKNNIIIDVLINNAALNPKVEKTNVVVSTSTSFENLSIESWNKEIAVNLTGTMLCCQVLGSKMQSGASIINIASIYGLVAPDQSIYPKGFVKPATYGVTKAGVVNLTKYLASYWGSKNVRVNCVVFGGVENNQDAVFVKKYNTKTPLGRMAKPDDFFGILNFLASDHSSYATGSIFVIDGGWTII